MVLSFATYMGVRPLMSFDCDDVINTAHVSIKQKVAGCRIEGSQTQPISVLEQILGRKGL